MKTLKTLATAVTMTLAMGVANLSFAAPTTAVTTNTAPASKPVATQVATTKTATKTTTVKQTPAKTVAKKVTASKSGFTCKDGSHSNARSTRGACSRHGGIAK